MLLNDSIYSCIVSTKLYTRLIALVYGPEDQTREARHAEAESSHVCVPYSVHQSKIYVEVVCGFGERESLRGQAEG